MGFRRQVSRLMASYLDVQIQKWKNAPLESQEETLQNLVSRARNTAFGKDHHFSCIKDYGDFKRQVPLRRYEGFASYIQRIIAGENNVLWPGRPIHFALTSGTTSGTKHIPISRDSINHHINTIRDASLLYAKGKNDFSLFDGKFLYIHGNPKLRKVGGIPSGRLTGISSHHIPFYLAMNRLPSRGVNFIEDWEAKIDAIVEESLKTDLRMLGGIPPWVKQYLQKVHEKTGKEIKDVFPNLDLIIYSGVDIRPYAPALDRLVGKSLDRVEFYAASEGLMAFQDANAEEGLLLNLGAGIFYEFVPASEVFSPNPRRVSLSHVELGVNYAVVLSTNAGLWGYVIGDTVKFVSREPFKISVTGRLEHFISAFTEHVIAEEVEGALIEACHDEKVEIQDFTVAPQVNPSEGLPYHEWFIEFSSQPRDMEAFALKIDFLVQRKNIYYKDLVTGKTLRPLKISSVEKNGFYAYMKSQGKLGEQNKIPHLANDRRIAQGLEPYLIPGQRV